MRIIFMGTPDFAVTILKNLVDAGHHIEMVFSQPDRPKGRGKKMQAPPVAEFATNHDLLLQQPISLKTPEIEKQFREIMPDVVVVAAYGKIIPENLLSIPKYGFINVHASLLPKYRGAAPIQWALRNGDEKTGISIMKLESGLDEGPVFVKSEMDILPEWNKKDLFDALAILGASCLEDTLKGLPSLHPIPQNHNEATYAPMFDKNDGLVDFSMSAKDIVNLNRSLMPDDSIYTFINNKRIAFKSVSVSDNIEDTQSLPGTIIDISKKALMIMTGNGVLCVTEIQPAGKKTMPVHAFLNGYVLKIGDQFTDGVDV